MRIAFIGSEVPNAEHSTVGYSARLFLQAFRNARHEVAAVLPLPQRSVTGDDATRQRWLRELDSEGVTVTVTPGDPPTRPYRGRLVWRLEQMRRLLQPRIADYFPHVALAGAMSAALERVRPDVVFMWSDYEGVAATHGVTTAPRFAFMGDPAHLPGLFRQYPPLAGRRSPLSPSLLLYRLEAIRKAQMMGRLLSQCDAVAALAAHHAEWFRRNGVPQCRHLPTMVPDWGGPDWERRRRAQPQKSRFKIVHMGHVTGTATLAGLYLLAEETLPVLEEALGDAFEVHICGKGDLPAGLRARLDRPSVRLRGFVDDIVAELLTADVFLVPTPIELGVRARIPYAWSTGCCVVAHGANAKGLAELSDGVNALLASDGQALAERVADAYRDPLLRHRIGRGGRLAYETVFSYGVAGGKVLSELEQLAGCGQGVPQARLAKAA